MRFALLHEDTQGKLVKKYIINQVNITTEENINAWPKIYFYLRTLVPETGILGMDK